MAYPIEKYKFVKRTLKNGNIQIIALSTYGGKVVKGKATCAPDDTYDEEIGKKLAAARCEVKVAQKRYKRATIKRFAAEKEVNKQKLYLQNCQIYEMDSAYALDGAEADLKNIIKSLK